MAALLANNVIGNALEYFVIWQPLHIARSCQRIRFSSSTDPITICAQSVILLYSCLHCDTLLSLTPPTHLHARNAKRTCTRTPSRTLATTAAAAVTVAPAAMCQKKATTTMKMPKMNSTELQTAAATTHKGNGAAYQSMRTKRIAHTSGSTPNELIRREP